MARIYATTPVRVGVAQPHDSTRSPTVRPYCLRSQTWESFRPYVLFMQQRRSLTKYRRLIRSRRLRRAYRPRAPRSAIISPFHEMGKAIITMEAERLNAIESSLADLRRRAGKLRGYL
ncbi:MAG: hypothetical protein VB125_05275 [Burkholderia sp.]